MTPSIVPTRALIGHETSGAADTAAWCLTGLLFFCIACFVWGAVVLRRRGCGCNPAVTGKEESVDSRKPTPDADASAGKAQPWERDGDWWKK